MRGLAIVALALLLAALAPAASGSSSPRPDNVPAASSFVIFLNDQRSHEASLAVRAILQPPIDALAAEKAALVRTPADLQDPTVIALNQRIDGSLHAMRMQIAQEASRLHEPTRAPVESLVRDLGGVITYESPLLNLIVASLPPDTVETIRADPLVAWVTPEGHMDVTLDVSVPSIGAPTFWSNGFTGVPYKIIVADTGVDGTHPALVGQVSNARTFHDAGRLSGNYADDPTTTDDLQGHGTHVAGITASTDTTYRGVEYGGHVINAKFGW
ncbi:MAG TPA: S8 family serine peptidase, partial [Thermoplasmata archaeon]|nr:S8 family serine peptidase [Thermoplasmata archaeon]